MNYVFYFYPDAKSQKKFKVAYLEIETDEYYFYIDPIEMVEAIKATDSFVLHCILKEFKWYINRFEINDDLSFSKILPKNFKIIPYHDEDRYKDDEPGTFEI